MFELLTARFWPDNIKLRELWQKALEAHPMIKEFEVDPYYVLQAIALASRKTPSCKRSDVLDLAPADITAWWPPVVAGLAVGLEILRDNCKMMLPKWLPYQTMLAPLAAVLAKSSMPKSAEAGAQREKLKRWFCVPCSVKPTKARLTVRRPRMLASWWRGLRAASARVRDGVALRPDGAPRRHPTPAFNLSRHDLPDLGRGPAPSTSTRRP